MGVLGRILVENLNFRTFQLYCKNEKNKNIKFDFFDTKTQITQPEIRGNFTLKSAENCLFWECLGLLEDSIQVVHVLLWGPVQTLN